MVCVRVGVRVGGGGSSVSESGKDHQWQCCCFLVISPFAAAVISFIHHPCHHPAQYQQNIYIYIGLIKKILITVLKCKDKSYKCTYK